MIKVNKDYKNDFSILSIVLEEGINMMQSSYFLGDIIKQSMTYKIPFVPKTYV